MKFTWRHDKEFVIFRGLVGRGSDYVNNNNVTYLMVSPIYEGKLRPVKFDNSKAHSIIQEVGSGWLKTQLLGILI